MVDRECEICSEEFESRAGALRCNACRKGGRRLRKNPREINNRDVAAYMAADEGLRLYRGLTMMSQDGR